MAGTSPCQGGWKHKYGKLQHFFFSIHKLIQPNFFFSIVNVRNLKRRCIFDL